MNRADITLAQKILAGDEAAVRQLFDGCFPPLYRFAVARLNYDADQAEDVVQATFCTALSKLHTYRGEAAILTWLFTLCRHELSAHYRRRGAAPVAALLEDNPEVRAAIESLGGAGESADETMERGEIVRLVHSILDRLPSHYGRALEWKYLEGIPVREIAARIGSSEKAAESMLTRARDAFRDAFEAARHAPRPRPAPTGE